MSDVVHDLVYDPDAWFRKWKILETRDVEVDPTYGNGGAEWVRRQRIIKSFRKEEVARLYLHHKRLLQKSIDKGFGS